LSRAATLLAFFAGRPTATILRYVAACCGVESSSSVAMSEAIAKRKPMGKSVRAGLVLASARLGSHLKQRHGRVSGAASVFLAAVVEDVLGQVAEQAAGAAAKAGCHRVGVSAIGQASRTEESLKVFAGYWLVTERVLPRPGNLLLTSSAIEKKKKKKTPE